MPPKMLLNPFGFSFSVAGLLFPYHIGVVSKLSSESYLDPSTPLNGASGGALAAACAAAGFTSEKSLSASLRVSKRCTSAGAFLNLEDILREESLDLCKDDMVEAINARPGRFEVLWTQAAFPKLIRPIRSAQPFTSPQNLIDVLSASSHIPLYSSISPFTSVRGSGLGVDGFLSAPSTLGCQDVEGATKSVMITPFAVVGDPSVSVIGEIWDDAGRRETGRTKPPFVSPAMLTPTCSCSPHTHRNPFLPSRICCPSSRPSRSRRVSARHAIRARRDVCRSVVRANTDVITQQSGT